jgi:hypothetical protein
MAVDLVMKGEIENAFCAVRPPGHHAEKEGRWASASSTTSASPPPCPQGAWPGARGDHRFRRASRQRHRGLLSGDEQVLMCSIFQHPFYPYSGADKPAANMCNVPLAAGCGGEEFRDAVSDRCGCRACGIQAADDLHLGRFRRHYEDDMGGLKLVEKDFAGAQRRRPPARAGRPVRR